MVSKLVSGVFAHDTATVSDTGPNSTNDVTFHNTNTTTVTNTNTLNVTDINPQAADSGNAGVSHNTTGGSATTGVASNTSDNSFTYNVNN